MKLAEKKYKYYYKKIIKKIKYEIRIFINSFIYYIYNNLLTFFPIFLIRKIYLKNLMKIKVGSNSFIHMGCIFYENVNIGNNSVIGRQCHLLGNIIIKNNVSITAQTYIFSSTHYNDSPTFEAYTSEVVIEDYAWIGARAMILPGVRIGTGAILGAASTATHDIDDYNICVGTPAKFIKMRSKDINYTLKYEPYFQ